MFALVVSGKRLLPSLEVMKQRISKDEAESRSSFEKTNSNWRGLVNWIPYMDTLATEIGCLPAKSLMLSDPVLWTRLLIGPMSAFHYRLHGPGSKPRMARAVIMKCPIGTRVADLHFYLGIHFTIALLCWPVSFLTETCIVAHSLYKKIM